MKKVKRLLTSFCVLAFAVLIGWNLGAVKEVKAENYNEYEYSVGEDGNVSITGITGDSNNHIVLYLKLVIPEKIEGKKVTGIGYGAFKGQSSLTSITIPDGVTSIGDETFSGCHSLTNISIPNGVTSIGSNTFYGCSALTDITIPKSVTSIGDEAFSGCSSLTSISIPESVTSIGDYTFC